MSTRWLTTTMCGSRVGQERYRISFPTIRRTPVCANARRRLKKEKAQAPYEHHVLERRQFQKLIESPPGNLYSKGRLPWRVLAHTLSASPDVQQLRSIISKRFMDTGRVAAAQKQLDGMLFTLWRGGFVELEPKPPADLASLQTARNATAREKKHATRLAQALSDVGAGAADKANRSASRLRSKPNRVTWPRKRSRPNGWPC